VSAGAGKTLYKALLLGVPVVDLRWLQDSIKQGELLPMSAYMAKVCVCWQ
jgi:hypothetical protein